MSSWAREHPEQMAQISRLPTTTEQLEALCAAIQPEEEEQEPDCG